MAVKYWARGSNDKKMSDAIYLAFKLLGYEFNNDPHGIFFSVFDSSNSFYYTLDDDKKVYHTYEGDSEFRVVTKLIELDDSFVELNPDDFVTTPKFELHDVLYNVEKMFKRCVVIEVDKYKQSYTVKDHNNNKFTIKFKDQDQWDIVIQPKFKEGDSIKDAIEVYIIDVDKEYQRYSVCEDGEDDFFYIQFKEQDRWKLL